MKLWEVIKELTDDPTKKFVFDDRDRIYTMSIDKSCGSNYFHLTAINEKGNDISHRDSGGFDGNLTTEDDWRPVKQPVTWQEAIQAWVDGKKAVWEEDAERRVFDRNKSWPIPKYQSHLLDQDGDAVTVGMISGGKWYVED